MREYDLIVVGGGSGNMIFGPELDGWTSAIIEENKFGGTCLHRGCVPSKMYVVAADVARTVRDAAHLDVRATYEGVDWGALRDRIFGRLDPTDERAVRYRERSGVDVIRSHTRFTAPKVLEVDGEPLTARHIVVAAGSRPYVPDIPGTRHGAVPHVGHDHADRRSPGLPDHRRRRVRRRGAGSRVRELRHRRHDPATRRAHADGRGRRRVDAVHRAVPSPDARADRRHRRARRAVGCRCAGHVA